MNDTIFNIQEHTGTLIQSTVILCGILTGFCVILLMGALILSFLKIQSDYFMMIGVIIVLGVSASSFLVGTKYVKDKQASIVYNDNGAFKSHNLKLNDFNEIMKNKYNYKFVLQNRDSKPEDYQYTAINLKNNEKFSNCYIKFDKVGNNSDKIKLKDVSCNKSIMQDILKNK